MLKVFQRDWEYHHHCTKEYAQLLVTAKKKDTSGKKAKEIWTYVVDFGSKQSFDVPTALFWMGARRQEWIQRFLPALVLNSPLQQQTSWLALAMLNLHLHAAAAAAKSMEISCCHPRI